ncbi:hypothetical protein [Cellulosimicrobium arenosum]|uniref:Uncharacterized protein n=1 Tax=Cellulosimicrobium arenosum TaxID=2708133 RepID=A0A927G867_9MICO|nr:hypothetical protein [Cellulosimicrobium arenosum]MBD8078349.1 hypothetical protein [Cellulosimicrobium arenosum]
MSIQLFGRWHLRVDEAVHTWENRFRVHGAASGDGTYPPTVGLEVTADGAAWNLTAEHRESATSPWKPSDMMIDPGPLDRVDVRAEIGAEDPLPSRDFKDVHWDARFLDGTLYEIPVRPFAVRTTDLFEMPDGIFETALRTYYLGVRVVNRWGLPFGPDHVLDVSAASRAELASQGITVLDAWTQSELAALGQVQRGTGIVVGALNPGNARTVYLKVDVGDAAPRKHEVEFVLRNAAGMADPGNPARFVRKQIFVSRTTVDPVTGEIVSEVQEGTLRVRLREVAIDTRNGRRARHRCPPPRKRRGRESDLDQLRRLLQELLDGRPIDPCLVKELLDCGCGPGRSDDPHGPSDGRFCYDPFYAIPTRFDYTVTPREPYAGQYGPIPFDDPWWKVLLLIIAAILLIAGMLSEAADVAYHDEDLVIGGLGRTIRDDVDAALCVLDTDRTLGFGQVLDARSDEDNQNAETALDGTITVAATIMPVAEVMALLADSTTPTAQLEVFKSGATTGLTHGLISGFTATAFTRSDGTSFTIPQLTIGPDPAFGENVSAPGDSGSVWVHRATGRPVALHHSGRDDPDSATASFLEDVFSQLGVTL